MVGRMPKLKKPVLLVGLPGIGSVGKITVDFICSELKPVKLCSFLSDQMPHSVFVNENDLIELPKIELYYLKKNKGNDLCFLVGDIQPLSEQSAHHFCQTVISLFKKLKGEEIITIGGIGLQIIPEKPKVYCTGTSKEIIRKYASQVAVEERIFGVVGPIIGVAGLLPGLAKKEGLEGVILLAETFGHPIHVGIQGAREIIKILDKKFSFNLDLKKLDQEIIKFEKITEGVRLLEKRMKENKETSYIG